MSARLDGLVAIVTGAGQGIGRGVALALAGEGAAVALVGRTPAKLESVLEEVRQRHGAGRGPGGQRRGPRLGRRRVAATIDGGGTSTSLVNNAQTLAYNSLRRLTEADLAIHVAVRPAGHVPDAAGLLPRTYGRLEAAW